MASAISSSLKYPPLSSKVSDYRDVSPRRVGSSLAVQSRATLLLVRSPARSRYKFCLAAERGQRRPTSPPRAAPYHAHGDGRRGTYACGSGVIVVVVAEWCYCSSMVNLQPCFSCFELELSTSFHEIKNEFTWHPGGEHMASLYLVSHR